MSTYSPGSRGDDGVDPDVTDRLASINGYGSRRDAARIGSRALHADESSIEDADTRYGDAADQLDDEDDDGLGRDERGDEDYDDEEYAGDQDEEYADDGDSVSEDSPDGGSSRWDGRLRAIDVHHAAFPRASFTRRGYDERSVDEFLSRVESEITWLVEEKADLRDEIARLRRQAKAGQDAPVPQMEEAQAQAVRLLAKAQQLADQYVAEAEAYSKRISQEARKQYDDVVAEGRSEAARLVDEAKDAAATIVQEAEEAARLAAERVAAERAAAAEVAVADRPATGAVPVSTAVTSGLGTIDLAAVERTQAEKRALEEQVAYLRTFSQVTRTQLRAYLEALLTDVEEEWGRAHPVAADGARPLPAGERDARSRQTPTDPATRRRRAREAAPTAGA